ncbi:MAG: hypothetical protein AAF560_33305, partial [Acidobacteriota bacterium]
WRRFFGPLFIHDLQLAADEYAAMPQFRFVEENAGERVWRQVQRLMTLGLWIGVFAALLFRSQVYARTPEALKP